MVNIPSFCQAHVCIVGDVMLDRYWYGQVQRISPEAPVPIVNIERELDKPGGAANVAINCHHLGAQVSLVGRIGKDKNGEALEQALPDSIRAILVRDNVPTITKLRVLSVNQQLMRLDFEEKFPTKASLLLTSLKTVSKPDILVLSDYAKGTLIEPQPFIAYANEHSIPVLIDPKSNDFSNYQGATLITPNQKELEAVIGPWQNEATLLDKTRNLLQAYQIKGILLTRGSEGMTLITNDYHEHLPAHCHEVYDVTGAGDTVIAVMALGMAMKMPWHEAMVLANSAASIVVEKLGAASVLPHELKQVVDKHQGGFSSTLTLPELASYVEDAKSKGQKVVFTNGCFDIIHAGHVAYLNEAKALGDRLIVAVNDDASVKALKGSDRPLNSLQQRLLVLAGLESVDWVIGFSEGTPESLLQELKPDILVKGGDYQLDEVVGAEIVKGYGGEVNVLSHQPNLSTTHLIQKMSKVSSSTQVHHSQEEVQA